MSQQSENSQNNLDNFLYPLNGYHGKFSPNNLAFNANLQEFAQKVAYICSLENNGKIPTEESYQRIRQLWKQLQQSKRELLDNTNFNPEDK
jgi:aconitase B